MRKLFFIIIVFAACSMVGYGQESIWEKIERKAKEKSEQKQEEAVDEGLNAAEEGAKDAAKAATTKQDKKKNTKQKEAVEQEEAVEEAPAEAEGDAAEAKAKVPAKPAFASYSKFDFVAGDKVLLYEDFSQDAVGDFPAKWNTNGSGEVVTLNTAPGKWFKMTGTTSYLAPLTTTLPENFTIEYDVIYPGTEGAPELAVHLASNWSESELLDAAVPGVGGEAFRISPDHVAAWNWEDGSYGKINSSKDISTLREAGGSPVRISLWFQKERLRVYVRETKVFDLPKMNPKNLPFNAVGFSIGTSEEDPLYLSNLRIAVGAPDMRNKLLTEGKLVTRGITFDTGSDKIRPESYGTLKGIADVLKENASLKVKVIGHTDSDGNEKSNLDLSKRRSASVKNTLVKDFGIEAARLSTDGKGQSEPSSPNTTPEGKANNRRVEFVKL